MILGRFVHELETEMPLEELRSWAAFLRLKQQKRI